jgi:TonB-linked SusC/RagA family outer membrane protein
MKKLLQSLFVLMFVAITAMAQDRTITGTVTSQEDGLPIPGVNVKAKGGAGTQTGSDGKFSLKVTAGASVDFTYLGYVTQTRTITGASVYNVSLVTDSKTLQEVVITDGYGVQQKKSFGGSAATVKSDAVAMRPATSILQALQGQVAGLNSVSSSGQPGASQVIRIRGIGSVSAGSAPLYVVDGMIINSGDLSRGTTTANTLAGINENDIESISVLKDAGASAIYGSRASNGVIIITTKRGKAGKTNIRADIELGSNTNISKPDAGRSLNAAEYSTLFQEALLNNGQTPAGVASLVNTYALNNGNDVDWYDVVTRTAQQNRFNVALDGGNEKTQFFVSSSYGKQQSTVVGSELEKVTGLLNLNHKISKRFAFSSSLNFSNAQQLTPSNGGGFANPVLASYFLRPQQNPYNTDGSLNSSRVGNGNFPDLFNPLYVAENDNKYLSTTKIIGNTQLKWDIVDKLKFTSFISVDYANLEENVFNNSVMGDGRTSGGRGYDYYTRYFNWLSRNQLDYRYDIPNVDGFYAEASLGYEAQRSKGYFITANSNLFPVSQPGLTSSINASTPIVGNSSGDAYTFNALYSRLALNFKNKYSLTGTYRRDGSSRFGSNNRFGNFWSVAGAWNIDEEEFFKGQNILSSAKLRSSYGVIGNAEIGNYAWRPSASYNNNYNGLPGQVYNVLGNEDLTWEASKPFDVGMDFGFFNNRLSFVVDYYKRKIDRLIFNTPVSRTTGFTTFTQNIGAMENKGWEFAVSGVPIKTKDFTWNTNFNISFNKNKITQLFNDQQIIDGSYMVREGADYRTWYVRLYAGVDPANGSALWYTDGTKTATTTNYNLAQRAEYGSASPKSFGGWNNTFTFKGLTLSADFYFNYGNIIQDGWSSYLNDGFNITYNKYAYNLNRWTTPGQVTDVPKFTNAANNSYAFSTRYLYSGDYFRLRNVSLGYDFKNLAFVKKYGLSKLYLYARGTNLWTHIYDKRLPFDPEVGVNSSSNLEVPQVKSFTFGLSVGL